MIKRLRFLEAWLPMCRGLRNIHGDWRAWDIGWRAATSQRLSRLDPSPAFSPNNPKTVF